MKFNLQKRFSQGRDYSWHKSMKLGNVALPNELLLTSPIQDQGPLDECTAFAAVATRFNETQKVFEGGEFWANELAFSDETTSDGFDIQVPAACAVENGFNVTGDGKPSAYYFVHPNNGMDLMDSCRTAMLQSNYPLLGGMDWYSDYTNATGGIITELGNYYEGGHCIKIAGWKQINGEPYMVLQNSWGATVGDNGLFYLSRDVFNASFAPYGVFLWSDSQNVTIKTLGLLGALWQNLIILLKR